MPISGAVVIKLFFRLNSAESEPNLKHAANPLNQSEPNILDGYLKRNDPRQQ